MKIEFGDLLRMRKKPIVIWGGKKEMIMTLVRRLIDWISLEALKYIHHMWFPALTPL